jgi:hypothetical protein
MGPLITWMAKVPAGQTADKFDASKGDFFKVHQEGQEGKKWYLERLSECVKFQPKSLITNAAPQ